MAAVLMGCRDMRRRLLSGMGRLIHWRWYQSDVTSLVISGARTDLPDKIDFALCLKSLMVIILFFFWGCS